MQLLNKIKKYELRIFVILSIVLLLASIFYFFESVKSKTQFLDLVKTLNKTRKELSDLKNQDQVKINEQLKIDIKKTI